MEKEFLIQSLESIYNQKGEITVSDVGILLKNVEDAEYEKLFKEVVNYLEEKEINLVKEDKVEEKTKKEESTKKEEYVPNEETYMIPSKRQDELISGVREFVSKTNTIANYQLSEIIGEVEEDVYDREYQFLIDYIKSQGITLRGTSLEMDFISELNGNETERTAGPGEVNYRTRKQEELLSQKRQERSGKRQELDKKNQELIKLKTELKGLEDGTEEYQKTQDDITKIEEEIKTIVEEIKELKKKISRLKTNLPRYIEQRNSRLFAQYAEYFPLKESLKILEKEKSDIECGEIEVENSEARIQEIDREIQKILDIRNMIAQNNLRLVEAALFKSDDEPTRQQLRIWNLPEGYDRDEMMQEGYIGLLKAIEEYDPKKGKLSTLAYTYIRNQVYEHAFLKKVPGPEDMGLYADHTRGALDYTRKAYEDIKGFKYDYMRAQNEIEREFAEQGIGRKPTINEIADRIGLTYERTVVLLELANRIEKLDDFYEVESDEPTPQVESAKQRDIGIVQPKSGDERKQYQKVAAGSEGEPVQYSNDGHREWAPAIEMSTPEAIAQYKDTQEIIARQFATLPDRERDVIMFRFGFTDGHPRTLDEVAREFGVNRERIRQLEFKVLAKLRHSSRGLSDTFETIDSVLTPKAVAEISEYTDEFKKILEEALAKQALAERILAEQNKVQEDEEKGEEQI